MPDDADITSDRSEREQDMLMRATRKPAGPRPTGFCHFCSEPVAAALRFCSVECRDDAEREARLRKLG
ncbi:MAG: hypothetical protein RIS35_1861 [Pseudomonadota bacterium]|jgi:hypothetical protein